MSGTTMADRAKIYDLANGIAVTFPEASSFANAVEHQLTGQFAPGTSAERRSEPFHEMHVEAKRIFRNGKRSLFCSYVCDFQAFEQLGRDNRNAAERMHKALHIAASELKDHRKGSSRILRELQNIVTTAERNRKQPQPAL